jgi:hypothetical protein
VFVVGRDAEQGLIRKRGAAKIRIDTASSDGHYRGSGGSRTAFFAEGFPFRPVKDAQLQLLGARYRADL